MNNPNIKIYFPDDNIYNIVSDILQKNGLDETPSDIVDKEESMIITVLHLTRDFGEEKITEEELINSLQKKLNVSLEIAKNIAQDAKEKILPKAEKITLSPPERETKFEKLPLSLTEIIEKPSLTLKEKSISTISQSTTLAEKSKQRAKKTNKTKITEEPTLKSQIIKQPDKYREPIE